MSTITNSPSNLKIFFIVIDGYSENSNRGIYWDKIKDINNFDAFTKFIRPEVPKTFLIQEMYGSPEKTQPKEKLKIDNSDSFKMFQDLKYKYLHIVTSHVQFCNTFASSDSTIHLPQQPHQQPQPQAQDQAMASSYSYPSQTLPMITVPLPLQPQHNHQSVPICHSYPTTLSMISSPLPPQPQHNHQYVQPNSAANFITAPPHLLPCQNDPLVFFSFQFIFISVPIFIFWLYI